MPVSPTAIYEALPAAALRLKYRRQYGVGTSEQRDEWEKCAKDRAYFIRKYIKIKDEVARDWVLFELWPAQEETLAIYAEHKRTVLLKARQLGQSWLKLADSLWEMLFHPAPTILIFSKRDEEAVELLDIRLKGMYAELPTWMKSMSATLKRKPRPSGSPAKPDTDAKHQWGLPNGSRAMAFPTTGGRSYTASEVIVDEADHIPDLDALLSAVQPTVDAGGALRLISTADKARPISSFKRIFLAAEKGESPYKAIFFPWTAHPARTQEWYAERKREILSRTGALDELWQEYPASVEEALAPRSLDKRIPGDWLIGCYKPRDPLTLHQLLGPGVPPPSVPHLVVYGQPARGVEYRMGADPAEGNPTSDFSACVVVTRDTGEEVARFSGRFEPSVFASYCAELSDWYNAAPILPERNNHGHAFILWLEENGYGGRVLEASDGNKGWLTTTRSKALMYSEVASSLREGDGVIHSQSLYLELASIEGRSLRAPDEQHDDEAVAWGLATLARAMEGGEDGISEEVGEALESWSGI